MGLIRMDRHAADVVCHICKGNFKEYQGVKITGKLESRNTGIPINSWICSGCSFNKLMEEDEQDGRGMPKDRVELRGEFERLPDRLQMVYSPN